MSFEVYNSFKECKINHPMCDVWKPSGYRDHFSPNYSDFCSLQCHAKDYLVSVEDFLNEGLQFHGGDLILDLDNVVLEVGEEGFTVEEANTRYSCDKGMFVVSAYELDNSYESAFLSKRENIINGQIKTTLKEVRKLRGKKDLAPEIKELCESFINSVEKLSLYPSAYNLYCEHHKSSGNRRKVLSYMDFNKSENKDLWLFVANKLKG